MRKAAPIHKERADAGAHKARLTKWEPPLDNSGMFMPPSVSPDGRFCFQTRAAVSGPVYETGLARRTAASAKRRTALLDSGTHS